MTAKAGHPLSILLVDDDPLIRDTLQLVIISLGHDCLTAGSGIMAVKMLADHDFDLMITDLCMPEMDGHQLLAHVAEYYPALPRIAISGHMDQVDSLNQPDQVDAVLRKPFSREKLAVLLAQLGGLDSEP